MEENFLLKTDSYKITHHLQYPEGKLKFSVSVLQFNPQVWSVSSPILKAGEENSKKCSSLGCNIS